MYIWMMLCMWGISLSIRIFSSIIRARYIFFRISGLSFTVRANRCCGVGGVSCGGVFSFRFVYF